VLTIVSVLRDGRRIECWLSGGQSIVIRSKVPPYFWSVDRLSLDYGATKLRRNRVS